MEYRENRASLVDLENWLERGLQQQLLNWLGWHPAFVASLMIVISYKYSGPYP